MVQLTGNRIMDGQIWQDKDKRMDRRRVVVERIEGEYAYCKSVVGGRKTRLLLRRMGPGSGTTGWRLIK